MTKYAEVASLVAVSPHDLRHRFGYRMAETVPLHRLAQIMGMIPWIPRESLSKERAQDVHHAVEIIVWA